MHVLVSVKILYCILLNCIELHWIALHCIASHRIALYCKMTVVLWFTLQPRRRRRRLQLDLQLDLVPQSGRRAPPNDARSPATRRRRQNQTKVQGRVVSHRLSASRRRSGSEVIAVRWRRDWWSWDDPRLCAASSGNWVALLPECNGDRRLPACSGNGLLPACNGNGLPPACNGIALLPACTGNTPVPACIGSRLLPACSGTKLFIECVGNDARQGCNSNLARLRGQPWTPPEPLATHPRVSHPRVTHPRAGEGVGWRFVDSVPSHCLASSVVSW